MPSDLIWTIGRILKWTEQYFEKHGIDTPRLDAEVLLSHVLGVKRIYLYVNFEKPLVADELSLYREFVKRRANHEPVAYIIGEREFMGLKFTVSSAVLVPQPDTETLVGATMDRLSGGEDERVLDIGTGSGAIILSLLHYMPELTGVAVDISPEALKVAQANATELGLESRVSFVEGDLTSPFGGVTNDDEKFNAIVSNPPYIKKDEIKTLAPEVQAEPHIALDGGADGLDFYRRLVANTAQLIRDGGFLAVEVGADEANDVVRLAMENGNWARTEKVTDLAGIERVIVMWRK